MRFFAGGRIIAFGFGKHEEVEETNFIDMKGCLYDSSIYRFISADLFIPDPKYSQAYNRYSYVINNPLKFKDPSGHRFGSIFHSFTNIVSNIINTATSPQNVINLGANIATYGIAGGVASTLITDIGITSEGSVTCALLSFTIAGKVSGFLGGAVATGLIEKGAIQMATSGGISGADNNFASLIEQEEMITYKILSVAFTSTERSKTAKRFRMFTNKILGGVSSLSDIFLDLSGIITNTAINTYKITTSYEENWLLNKINPLLERTPFSKLNSMPGWVQTTLNGWASDYVASNIPEIATSLDELFLITDESFLTDALTTLPEILPEAPEVAEAAVLL